MSHTDSSVAVSTNVASEPAPSFTDGRIWKWISGLVACFWVFSCWSEAFVVLGIKSGTLKGQDVLGPNYETLQPLIEQTPLWTPINTAVAGLLYLIAAVCIFRRRAIAGAFFTGGFVLTLGQQLIAIQDAAYRQSLSVGHLVWDVVLFAVTGLLAVLLLRKFLSRRA